MVEEEFECLVERRSRRNPTVCRPDDEAEEDRLDLSVFINKSTHETSITEQNEQCHDCVHEVGLLEGDHTRVGQTHAKICETRYRLEEGKPGNSYDLPLRLENMVVSPACCNVWCNDARTSKRHDNPVLRVS